LKINNNKKERKKKSFKKVTNNLNYAFFKGVKENIQIESAILNFINNKKNENKSKTLLLRK